MEGEGRRKVLLLAGASALVVLAIIVIFITSIGSKPSPTNLAPSPTQTSNRSGQSNNNTSKNALPENKKVFAGTTRMDIRFRDLKDYNDAAEIFPSPSTKTQKALDEVFDVQITALADGSKQVVLKAKDPAYKIPSFVVKPTNKLYAIDLDRGLVPLGRILDPGDLLFVLVDNEGYVLGDDL